MVSEHTRTKADVLNAKNNGNVYNFIFSFLKDAKRENNGS
jgi:hypothetical protein